MINGHLWLTRLVRLRIFGKSPIGFYLRLNRKLWNMLPTSIIALSHIRAYGSFLHTLVKIQCIPGQLLHTFFLRNRPALEPIRHLVESSTNTDRLRVAVLGCSTGAEAYSVAWTIRSSRSDLEFVIYAMDISEQAVDIARRGVYSLTGPQFSSTDIFDCMTETEIADLFNRDGEVVSVKSWIKKGIEWKVGDVGAPEILHVLGPQDIVIANNFLCHMNAEIAEKCLRNISRLVSPNGYLFVSGVDLDIRTKVAKDLGWKPLQELIEEIHKGDPRMGRDWPWNYSSLEPLNKRRRDWETPLCDGISVACHRRHSEYRRIARNGEREYTPHA